MTIENLAVTCECCFEDECMCYLMGGCNCDEECTCEECEEGMAIEASCACGGNCGCSSSE